MHYNDVATPKFVQGYAVEFMTILVASFKNMITEYLKKY